MKQVQILFYDGDCALCNLTVKLVVRFGYTGAIPSSLDGDTAMLMLPKELRTPPFNGVVFTLDNEIFLGVKAIKKLSENLVFPLSIFGRIMPGFIYSIIASNRYLFGRKPKSSCTFHSDLKNRILP